MRKLEEERSTSQTLRIDLRQTQKALALEVGEEVVLSKVRPNDIATLITRSDSRRQKQLEGSRAANRHAPSTIETNESNNCDRKK
jgi:hypothetical protein